MKCSISSLQLENVITRINNGSINLQPDFQRGEVWSVAKQKKLIDTILRRWTMPPIHVVPSKEEIDEVLDGQQRLVAIRDFCSGQFSIDGKIKPLDKEIEKLNNLKYDELPEDIKRRFLRYEISFVTLTDCLPSEPAELFDRLNQPMKLTSAEQRNAYMGSTRDQVKILVELFEKAGADRKSIGFSNSRLSYDEIISKFCYAIDTGTLKRKIQSNDITNRYRNNVEFTQSTIDVCEKVLLRFMNIVKSNTIDYRFSFNKASIFSWFVFLKQQQTMPDNYAVKTMLYFEVIRDYIKGKKINSETKPIIEWYETEKGRAPYIEIMINTFSQRASMASTDAISIIYRDIILHIFSLLITKQVTDYLTDFESRIENNVVAALDNISAKYKWGEQF